MYMRYDVKVWCYFRMKTELGIANPLGKRGGRTRRTVVTQQGLMGWGMESNKIQEREGIFWGILSADSNKYQ